MDKDGSIGVFDSGIGGVTVLRELKKILPNENYIFYSDSINNPYGDKTDKEIIEICDNIVKKLICRGCKAIVIACNTASAKAAKYLRSKYINIPILAIEPAYKMVHDYSYNKPTLVMATKGTIESDKFNNLYQKYNNHKTYLYPCVGLADVIEEGNSNKICKYIEDNIGKYKNKVENIVLGCTHYPLVEEEIKNTLGDNIAFFDGASGLAKHFSEILDEYDLKRTSKGGSVYFVDTSNKKAIKEERFYKFLNEAK